MYIVFVSFRSIEHIFAELSSQISELAGQISKFIALKLQTTVPVKTEV